MRIIRPLLAPILVLTLLPISSCVDNKHVKTTDIIADFEEPIPDSVRIIVEECAFDSTYALHGNSLHVRIPASKTGYSRFWPSASACIIFISDGTTLTFNVRKDRFNVTSDSPKKSVDQRRRGLAESNLQLLENIANGLTITQKTDYIQTNLKAIKDNRDNIIAVEALNNVKDYLTQEELDPIISTLSDEIKGIIYERQ